MMTAFSLDEPTAGATDHALRERANALRVAIDRTYRHGRAPGRPGVATYLDALERIERELARRRTDAGRRRP
jgi:hypothetical protein